MPIRTSLLFLELTVFDLEVMLRTGSYAYRLGVMCFAQGVMHFVQDDTPLMLTPIGSVLELCSLTSMSFAH